MGLVLFGLIVGIVIYTYMMTQSYKPDLVEYILGAILAFLLSIIAMLLLSLVLVCSLPKHYGRTTIPIISLKSGSETEGNFSLGFGTVEGVEYYYCYQDLGNNRYIRLKVAADSVIIVENSKIKPCYTYCYSKTKYPNWLPDIELERGNQQLIVPKGTVIRKFSLN